MVTVSLEATVRIGPAAPLFTTRLGPTRNFGFDVNYTATRDGRRFLISTVVEGTRSPSTTIVLNWTASVDRR
jgi:hypothetical protein